MTNIMKALLSASVLLFVSSCQGGGGSVNSGYKAQNPSAMKKFPPIKNYNVSLYCLTKDLEFHPGEDVKLTFGMRNIGKTSFLVYEWMMNESDNLLLSYCPSDENSEIKANATWKKEVSMIKQPTKRMPLELAPGNTVLMDKTLGFVKDLPENISSTEYYLISVELNLETMSAKSAPVMIKISPKANSGSKQN